MTTEPALYFQILKMCLKCLVLFVSKTLVLGQGQCTENWFLGFKYKVILLHNFNPEITKQQNKIYQNQQQQTLKYS